MHITHKAEDLLDQLRAKKLEYQEPMLDALYDAFDEVLNLVEAAEDCGDVVGANEETSAKILKYLDEVMGVSEDNSVATFSLPEVFVSSSDDFSNFEELDFDKLTQPLPQSSELNADNLNQSRAYAIFFDLDKSCMIFGNDPLYALSLLGDKVKYIATSLTEEDAKKIISDKDEDGLELYLKITALVEAGYEEIEDALYNFIDDIVLLPLSSENVQKS
jgi:chemotaxis protein histidine kinase CheA